MKSRFQLWAIVISMSSNAAYIKAAEPCSYVTGIGIRILQKDDMYSTVMKYLPKGTILQQIRKNDDNMQHVTCKCCQGWICLDESEISRLGVAAP